MNKNLSAEKKLGWPKFGREWYAGCSTLVIGNSIKAGIRKAMRLRWRSFNCSHLVIGFVSFDQYKTSLASTSVFSDENGKITGPGTVIAGFGAGITESLLAVTPFESIKTSLYDFIAI